MGTCLLSSTLSSLRICHLPRILLPYNLSFPKSCSTNNEPFEVFATRHQGLQFYEYHDGTINFAHGYPSFAVSVGVLYRGKPATAAVTEFVGVPMCWNTHTFSAAAGKEAFANGEKIHVSGTDKVERSLLVTGFGYDYDDPWATNMELFKEFTDISRIVEEAGGKVSCMDGGRFSVFDRSVLVSNGLLHAKLLKKIGLATENLKSKGIDFSVWFKPENYRTEV